MGDQERGCIAFFTSYRPPLPLHIYTCPEFPTSKLDEIPMGGRETDSYNYNGQSIPERALKMILRYHGGRFNTEATEYDVDRGRVTGTLFVSERTNGLETLHIGIRYEDYDGYIQNRVRNFAQVFGLYNGAAWMEDSGCFARDYLVFVSTKEPATRRRQPWTAVYKTHLRTGSTKRLTPQGVADLNPSVSPCGRKVAVASFQNKVGGWNGEIENLRTDIFVMDVDCPSNRTLVIENGGWPTWGSDDVIFFHRKEVGQRWGVFQAYLNCNYPTSDIIRITPEGTDAVTPAAIDADTVAVATIHQKSDFGETRIERQYRHIEIFASYAPRTPIRLTRVINPLVDHFNPFVFKDYNGRTRIGYHRIHDVEDNDYFESELQVVQSSERGVGVCRASGAFPSFSKDGKKIAFVDNDFKIVYVADEKNGKHEVYRANAANGVYSPIWDQNERKDTLYICVGNAFNAGANVEIWAIHGVSGTGPYKKVQLTRGGYNNAFPSTNEDGTRLVFRSTRDWMHVNEKRRHKNLYIMEDTRRGESRSNQITRLTRGSWTDTHCEWSPNGEWIVFASSSDKPYDAADSDNGLDPGYFAVFLVLPDDPDVMVRVTGSGYDLAGHVNHPFFSPDGKSLVVVSDLAGVSVDPISMPLFTHSVRPYGDIFIIDIDPYDIDNNESVGDHRIRRLTHTRFENSTATWAMVSIKQLQDLWVDFFYEIEGSSSAAGPSCPFLQHNGGHSFQTTGHFCVGNRRC